MTSDLGTIAKRAIAALDLTNLNDDCTPEDIRTLCARAQTPYGPTAAICIWPRFVAQAVPLLRGTGVRIATVIDFPTGEEPSEAVREATEAAVADGAQEIDMVIPYRQLIEGHPEEVPSSVARVKVAAGTARVKAILETGVLGDAALIRQAADLSIAGGADFIKTSTGKVPINATPEAARVMLEAIAAADHPVGFKPAGGVRTIEDAQIYLDLCDDIMGPDWATPQRFRIGASGVLDSLIATLEGREEDGAGTEGY